MSETMSHDAFLDALQELHGSPAAWRERLPAEALAHAEGCAECSKLAEAMALFAVHGDEVLGDSAPTGYWESFGERLQSRIDSESGAVSGGRNDKGKDSKPWPLWIGLAAALLLAVLLPRLLPSDTTERPDGRQVTTNANSQATTTSPPGAGDEGELSTESYEALLLASFGDQDPLWSLDETWVDSLGGPQAPSLDGLTHDESEDMNTFESALSGSLDSMSEDEAMDLMAELRKEMAS